MGLKLALSHTPWLNKLISAKSLSQRERSGEGMDVIMLSVQPVFEFLCDTLRDERPTSGPLLRPLR
jgi:hypothetical protein